MLTETTGYKSEKYGKKYKSEGKQQENNKILKGNTCEPAN